MNTQDDVQAWLNTIAQYEREFKKWEERTKNIIEVYRDDKYKTRKTAKFNILWANVQTLVPATYARLPQPDVSRRFKDNDPVGRVAGMILERALDFEIQHYPDFRETMRQAVLDRFLGGRGTAWARYEPHIRAMQQSLPQDGEQVTEDVDEPEEQLDYECAPTDYVHWRDFGHTVARTWEEVSAVWRKVYLTREACVERFGDAGNKIPLDSRPEDQKKNEESPDARALIYEIWDKSKKEAIWLSKSLGTIVDRKPDPLEVEGFFPCPKPLFATLTNESLVPLPDYTLYQDQAQALDIICDRIDGLIKALQVKGVYNSEFPELARLFTEGENNTLIPVKNFMAFAEKQGLKGAIDILDITPIFQALNGAYQAMEQQKAQIYEITGLSDIIRGQSDPNETLGAQEMKGQFASLRLGDMKQSVAMFATEILRLKAQIMCGKFDAQTLLTISAADQFTPTDQQFVPQAIQLLLGDKQSASQANPLRSFRIDIAADSLVNMDENAEKQARTEMLGAVGGYVREALPLVQQAPEAAPMVLEMLKFGVSAFKVGKGIEGVIDETLDKIREQLNQPQQPQPDPEMVKVQAQQQADQARLQHDQQVAQMQTEQEQMRIQLEQQAKEREMQFQAAIEQQKQEHATALERERMQSTEAFERWKAELDAAVKIMVAQISAKASLDQAALSAEQAAAQEVESATEGDDKSSELIDMHGKTLEAIKGVMEQLAKPKTVVRDASGRVTGVQ